MVRGVAVASVVGVLFASAATAQTGPAFNWSGYYAGLNVGVVKDHNDVGQINLTSPGFVFTDPTGAFAGIPTGFFGFPGAFQSVPTNQSGPSASIIGGGQFGRNWQSGRIVYGVEADLQFLRSRQTVSGTLAEFTPGVLPTGNISRTTTATFTIERLWEASLRGRVGYAWDRTMAYVTGGIAATSLKSNVAVSYATTICPALGPFPASPPVNLSGTGPGDTKSFLGMTLGAGFEHALTDKVSVGAEYRYTDFGKRNFNLGSQPPGGVLLPSATPVEAPVHLTSHQFTARLNYRFGPTKNDAHQAMAAAIPVKAVRAAPAFDWNRCYVGGYAGVAWSRSTVDTFDPSTNRAVFGPPPFVQTPFYSAGAGLSAAPAPYSYNLENSVIGGATLGCNWQAPGSLLVWGTEAEGGFMRLSAVTGNPYTQAFGFNDTTDSTRIGNWYAIAAGRFGYAVERTLLYAKVGVGLTHIEGTSIDTCTTGAGCSAQTLNATGSATPLFLVLGGGVEWAWSEKWTMKVEYLYLGVHKTFAVCGPGGGGVFVANLTFCSNHTVSGIHTVKLGVNYRLN